MHGELVIVRVFDGLPLVRRVWGYSEDVVYITDDETFKRLSNGDKDVMPVGFPKEDVFKYDPRFFEEKSFNWKRLVKWDGH